MGSAVAAKLAAELVTRSAEHGSLPVPSGIILDAPFTCLADAALHHPISRAALKLLAYFGGSKLKRRALSSLPDKWNTVSHVSSLAFAKIPLLVIANASDEVVPAELSRKVYENGRRAAASDSGKLSARFVEIAARKVLKRYHVDTFTTHEWIASVGLFLGDLEEES